MAALAVVLAAAMMPRTARGQDGDDVPPPNRNVEVRIRINADALRVQGVRALQRQVGAETGPALSDDKDATQYLEESETAKVLFERIRERLAADDVEGAVPSIRQLVEIGPEAVIPGTGEGVALTLRRMLYGLDAAVRARYEAAVGQAAEDAFDAARTNADAAAYAEVVAQHPATDAARRAAAHLWAASFEAARFRRSIEQVRRYLEDPLLSADQRRAALLVCAVAAASLGDRPATRNALAQLRQTGEHSIAFAGGPLNPVATVETLLDAMAPQADAWGDVGGNPGRNQVAPPRLGAAGPFVFSKESDRDVHIVDARHLPTRRKILQRRVTQVFHPEHVTLVTPRTFLVGRENSLVALDRISGGQLWRLDVTPPGQQAGFVAWPSAAEGYVAAMSWAYPAQRGAAFGRVRFTMSRNLGMFRRRLVVVSETSGEQVWSWDGSDVDASADLWTAPGVAERPGGATLPEADPPAAVPLGGNAATALAAHEGLDPVGSPLVYGGRVFVGAAKMPRQGLLMDCFLLCFDLPTGKLLWQRFIGSGYPVVYAGGGNSLDRLVPSTDGHRVFAESPVGTLVALDLAVGEVVWAKRLRWPQATNAWNPPVAAWPGKVGHAPIVAGDRLLVAEVDASAVRCLDARTGATHWSAATLSGGWPVGVAHGALVVNAGGTLAAYDVRTGTLLWQATLPAEVTGRGFVAADAVYVPTAAGLVRVDWGGQAVRTIYHYGDDVAAAQSVAPLADGLLSNHADRALLFGRVGAFAEAIRRGAAEHPDDPQWRRRLAELCRQQGDFPAAESNLQEAVLLAARLPEADRSRGEQLVAYQRMQRLYRQWAEALGAQGKTADATAKLRRALDYATNPAAKISTWMALARHCEEMGDLQGAVAGYARVAAHDVAQRMFKPTSSPGLEQTVAAQADSALDRLRQTTPLAAAAQGIRREDIERLEVRQVAMVSWSPMSYALGNHREPVAPIVWSRPDGLVAFGRRGDIRWRYTRAAATRNIVPSVLLAAGAIFEKLPEALTVHRSATGEVVWQWRPPAGSRLAELDPIMGVVRGRMIRRIQRVNNQVRIITETHGPGDAQYADFAVTGGAVVVATRNARTRRDLVVHGINLAGGTQRWESALPKQYFFAGMRTAPNKVVVLAVDPRRMLVARCLDAASGKTLWEHHGSATRNSTPKCLLENGTFVCIDATGRGFVLDGATGELLWESSGEFDFWAGSTPVAIADDRILLAHNEGYVALSRDKGEILWQVQSARATPTFNEVGSDAAVMARGMLVATVADAVAAIDPASGRVLWRHDTDRRRFIARGVLVCDDLVVVYGGRELRVNLNGREMEVSARFLELDTGKLVGEVKLGAGGASGQLRVTAIPGGFVVQSGNEILSVAPAGSAADVPGDYPGI